MKSEQIMDLLQTIAQNNNGLIQTKKAVAAGVSRAMLSKLNAKGTLSRIAVGQYVFSSELVDEMQSLSQRSHLIVFSHESALFLNGISERTPLIHAVTIPSSKKLGASLSKLCKVYYVKDALIDLGKTTLLTPQGNPVPAYDPERTLCDVIRSRNRMATETFLSSLKRYATSPYKNLVQLSSFAKAFGLTRRVNNYLEVLL